MMHDSLSRVDPVLILARSKMELVANSHLFHLAIVSGRDKTELLEFNDASRDEMMRNEIPARIAEIRALGVIISSPRCIDGRYGAVVTLIDRTLEAFYVPIVRIVNMEWLIGDFRATEVPDPSRYQRILQTLSSNWLTRGEY